MKKIVYLLSLVVMFTLLGCGTSLNTSSQSSKITITKVEYEQIKNDMTYEQVSKIIGGNGEFITQNTDSENNYYIAYQYKGEGDLGANANFVFKNGKMLSKAQIGLK